MEEKKQVKFEDAMQEIEKTIENISTKVEKKEELDANKNLFCILGVQDFEIRHSNFLAWMFRNNKQFFYEFLTNKKILDLSEEKAKSICNSCDVIREYNEDTFGRSIDLVIDCPNEKIVIVIENKIYSDEGENQLSDYYLFIEQSKRFSGYTKKYIYLTLNGDVPYSEEDRKHYVSVSYNSILDILTKIDCYKKNKKYKDYKDIIIEDYIDILKDKTVKVMDRVSEYYKLFDKYKEIMIEVGEYIPSIEKRAQIEKDVINTTCNVKLKSEKANTFVVFYNEDVQKICAKNNLPESFFEFGISNDPYTAMSFYFTVEKDKDGKYVDFSKKFREKFNRKDKSKNGNFLTLYEERMIVSNKTSGFLKESEFQEQIKVAFENLLNNAKSIYNEIVYFIKEYFVTK